MDRIYRPNLTQVNNVALGSTWSVNHDIGPAYRSIDYFVTMTTAAGKTANSVGDFFDLTTLFANDKPFRTFLGLEHDKIMARYGAQFQALIFKSQGGTGSTPLQPYLTSGALTAPAANSQTTCRLRVHFEEPWRKTWSGAAQRKFFTKWPANPNNPGTGPQLLTGFQTQSLIPNTANNAGATNVSVQVSYATDNSVGLLDAKGNPITNTLRWQRYPGYPYSAAGDLPVNGIIKYSKGTQLAILEELDFFSQSTGDDITRLQVNFDGQLKFDASAAANWTDLIDHGLSSSALDLDQFPWITDATDNVTDGMFLSTGTGQYVQNLAITATMGAAAGGNKTLVSIAQVYQPLD